MSKRSLVKRVEALEYEEAPPQRLRISFSVGLIARNPDDPPGTDPAQRYRDAGQTYFNSEGEEYYWFYLGDLPLGHTDQVHRRDHSEQE